jgi:hypothetical protein
MGLMGLGKWFVLCLCGVCCCGCGLAEVDCAEAAVPAAAQHAGHAI